MPDFRYALRSLARSPGFTLAVILTLAVGIAANTTIVTIASGLALRLIPAPDAERLVRLYPLDADGRRGTVFSRAEYELLRGRAAGVQELVAYIPRTVTARATRGGSPREILAYSVTGNYFDALGAASAQGRLLAAIDDTAGAAPVAVISHRIWTELGGRADLTGTTLLLNGATFTIVGVAPRSFVGTEPLVPDVWVPLSASAPDAGSESPVLLLCRLRPGARSALVEFGIRMALGAGAPDIVRLSLCYSWRVIAPGVATGVVLALLIAQTIAAFLFDISPTDALTYGGVTLVASGSAVGACLFPALRATRVEPMSVLRTE